MIQIVDGRLIIFDEGFITPSDIVRIYQLLADIIASPIPDDELDRQTLANLLSIFTPTERQIVHGLTADPTEGTSINEAILEMELENILVQPSEEDTPHDEGTAVC